jgi:2-methylisocitrate lyase-like PEP mutase family enzyme
VRFHALHKGSDTFPMPNAWNLGSVRMLSAAAFPAIATSSGGIAFLLGLPDYGGHNSRNQMMDPIRRAAIEMVHSDTFNFAESHISDAIPSIVFSAWQAR